MRGRVDVFQVSCTKWVKKIAAGSKSASFRGSDLSFEDLASPDSSKFNFELLAEEPSGKTNCYILERTPISDDTTYSKTRLWIDKEKYLLYKVLYFRGSKEPSKQLTLSNYI